MTDADKAPDRQLYETKLKPPLSRLHGPKVHTFPGSLDRGLGDCGCVGLPYIALSEGPTYQRSSGPLNRKIDGNKSPSYSDKSDPGGFGKQ